MSIDYSTLSLPDEIEAFLRKLTDIEIDKYSDKGGNGYLFFGKQKILNTRVALKFYGIDRHAPCHDEPAILHILVDNTCGRPIIADFGSIKKLPDGAEEMNASRHAFIYLPPGSG